jgi:hypothetical protein
MGPPEPASRADRRSPRELWATFEAVHAVTYFAPECREHLAATGLRGFWMAYFAARSAPLGAVGPAVVSATFFNFHPSMVNRSIPDAWSFASPATVLAARRQGAAACLRRVLPEVEREAASLVPLLSRVVEGADGSGRALFGANRALGPVDDPVEGLWQGCTSLREHRGDGHVAALVADGFDACEALVALAVAEGIPGRLFLDSRGWSADEWESARHRLDRRGLLDGDRLSPTGSALRRTVEETTDRLAEAPWAVLDDQEYLTVAAALERVAGAVTDGGVIPFPNPIGLPAPG